MRMIKKILSSREVPQIQFTSKFICIFIARRRFLQMPIVGSICIKYFWPCLSGTYMMTGILSLFIKKFLIIFLTFLRYIANLSFSKLSFQNNNHQFEKLPSTSTSFKQKMQKLKITCFHLVLT